MVFYKHENARCARILFYNHLIFSVKAADKRNICVPSDFKYASSSLERARIPFMEIFCAQYEQYGKKFYRAASKLNGDRCTEVKTD